MNESYMELYGETTKIDNGSRIVDICVEYDATVTNTKLKHKNIHKFTRKVRSRNAKSFTDYCIDRI